MTPTKRIFVLLLGCILIGAFALITAPIPETGWGKCEEIVDYGFCFDDKPDHIDISNSCYAGNIGAVTQSTNFARDGDHSLLVWANKGMNSSGPTFKNNHVIAQKQLAATGRTGKWRYSVSAYIPEDDDLLRHQRYSSFSSAGGRSSSSGIESLAIFGPSVVSGNTQSPGYLAQTGFIEVAQAPTIGREGETGPEISMQNTREISPGMFRTMTAGIQYQANPFSTEGNWAVWTADPESEVEVDWQVFFEQKLMPGTWYELGLEADYDNNKYIRFTLQGGVGENRIDLNLDLSDRVIVQEDKFDESAFWLTLECESLYNNCDSTSIFDYQLYYDCIDLRELNTPVTPEGEVAEVIPVDETTGEEPVSLTFGEVAAPGVTSLEISSDGSPPPTGFNLGDPPVYYDISTTATVVGDIDLCIDYSDVTFADETALRLYHFDNSILPDGEWVDVTSTQDLANNIICGLVASLSPFAMFENTLPRPFVFQSDRDIKLEGNVESAGDMHANGDILFAKAKGEPGMHTGNLTAVGNITLEKDNKVVGDVKAGGQIDVQDNAIVTGFKLENQDIQPVSLPSLSFSAGGADKKIAEETTASLEPGTYGRIKLEKDATLSLTSGEYFVEELEIDKGAMISLDVSSGTVALNVAEEMRLAKETIMDVSGGEGNSAKVTLNLLQATKFEIGKSSTVLGTIIAPNAEVHLSKNSQFRGAICAKEITVAKEVTFLHHNSPGSLPKRVMTQAGDVDLTDAGEIPTKHALFQNYPNPFNPTTTISFDTPKFTLVRLTIHNLSGQVVRILHDGTLSPGSYEFVWDGKDAFGVSVSTGIYLYKLEAKGFRDTRKLVLAK